MLNNEKLLEYSLVNGLIYLLTLREFCLNIYFSFLENNQNYKDAAINFYQKFSELTNEILKHTDGNLSEKFLTSGALITEYTIPTLKLTEKLFSTTFSLDIIEQMRNIKPGSPTNVSDEEIEQITMINKVALIISLNFKDFLKEIFEKETNNELFSYSYPFLIGKLIQEVDHYILILERLIRRIDTDPTFAVRNEYQSLNLLKAFGMFLRTFIDPSRRDLIVKTQSFIIEFENLLNEYKDLSLSPENQKKLTSKGLNISKRFKNFMASIIQQLLNKEVYLIVEPLFLDNMYRSINGSIYFVFRDDLIAEMEEDN
ncbi:MAG: DUF2935 domain-containing protein [Bacilli bacterium]|nr:DUF2935 domain-containing protein [Bacilli bacterium]